MSREIKIRAWDGEQFLYLDLNNIESDINLEWLLLFFKLPKQLYTGLKNKNGKEVYEGEIITYYGYNYAIEFQDGCFGIMDGDDFITLSVLQLNGWWIDPIGNIYENPELLEE